MPHEVVPVLSRPLPPLLKTFRLSLSHLNLQYFLLDQPRYTLTSNLKRSNQGMIHRGLWYFFVSGAQLSHLREFTFSQGAICLQMSWVKSYKIIALCLTKRYPILSRIFLYPLHVQTFPLLCNLVDMTPLLEKVCVTENKIYDWDGGSPNTTKEPDCFRSCKWLDNYDV